MKHLSISSKLLWVTSILFLTTVTILSFSLWWTLTDKNAQLSKQIQHSLHEEIQQKLTATSADYSAQIAGFINEAYRIPYSLAGILERTAKSGDLDRHGVETSLAATIQKNEQLSALYAQFETNAYDGLDYRYQAGASHSVPGSGTLEIYYIRNDDGSVTQEQVDDAEEKYLSGLNEFGLREAEWFLCAKESKQPCLMEPYLEEVTSGNKVLMTSLTVPVIIDQQFRGVVGADIHLPVFQRLIDKLSATLYQGKAKVTLLSSRGGVIAASHNTNIGRPLAASIGSQQAKKYQQLHLDSGYLETAQSIIVASPINIGLSNSVWSLIIEVPTNIAYKTAIDLDHEMTTMVNSLGRLQIITGLIVSVIAVLAIYLLVRSIITPLKTIQSRVEALATNDGDLTQSITIESHAELIALSRGFNAFITKLKHLINELKNLAGQSHRESFAVAKNAQLTKDSVQRQSGEVESIVTAINQMSATAVEIAQASEKAAVETHAISKNVQQSEDSLAKAMAHVKTMSTGSLLAKEAVNKVADSSQNINSIIEVIRSIADQTNLLALNAAIEAARAGEQGRGFAVVADEVRALASKTQSSTNDISKLIDALQHEVHSATDIIDKGAEGAQLAVAQTEDALSAINAMVGQISEISSQVTYIATAAEEQNVVTEEVNRNISGISNSVTELVKLANEALQTSNSLTTLVKQQHEQLDKLKT